MAYVGRLDHDGSGYFVIAGVHALGSVGAVDYLGRHLRDLYKVVGDKRFSMVVASEHDGELVPTSELRCPPRAHS